MTGSESASLEGKSFVLTGGKRIGQEAARRLAERGANVALTFLNSEAEAKATGEIIEREGAKCFVGRADVTSDSDVAEFVDAAGEFFGALHGLVYMASLFPKAPDLEPSLGEWRKMLDVHLIGAELFSRHLRPHLERNKESGKMVIFSDGAAENGRPYAGFRHYLVSKAAASALVRALAVDFGPKILVNGIAPGPVLPPPDYTPEEVEAVADTAVLKRWGGAEEIARAVIYLLEQNFMTGQVLVIDGGRYLISS